MPQSFNGYNSASQSSHATAGQNFEGLSNSLIIPDPSTPVQQTFGSSWPGPQGWQNHGQNHFNYGLTFPPPPPPHPPPPPLDPGAYFPNNQEDFVPFDKSTNFYENENMVTDLSAGARVPPLTAMGEVEENDATREQMKSRLQELMRHPAMKRPSSDMQGQQQVQHTAAQNPASKPDINAHRAAELRAKLLAKRSSTPGAPPSVSSKPLDLPKGKSNDVIVPLKPTDGSQASSSVAGKTSDKVNKAPPRANSNDNPPTNPSTPSLEKANASTDIDGLFAEARAAVAAESNNAQKRASKVEITGTRAPEKSNNKPTTTAPVEKPPEASTSENRRRSFNTSTPSSEMSELGEIRSDSGKPSRTSNPSEATRLQETKETREESKENRDSDRNFVDENFHRPINDDVTSKETVKSNTQSFEADVMTSPKASRNVLSNKSDMSAPQHLVQNPKIDNRHDRNGNTTSTQESRKDSEQIRRPGPNFQEGGNRSRATSGYQQWSPYDRDRSNYQRDGEGRRPQPPRYDVNESARAAAEYKRELEARRQQAASHKAEIAKDHHRDKAEPAKDYSKKERDVGQQLTPKKTTNEAQQFTHNSRSNDQYVKTVDDVKAISRMDRANDTTRQLSEQENHDKIEDVRDWLEMTGYFDLPYRKKGLARFRKLRAIDIEKAELERERAELEREAQLDLEGRSHFARSQSAFPGESVERNTSGSIISSQILRSSISAMPPPPVPNKEATDDMGIKIKDSANREGFSSRRANDEVVRSAPKHYEGVKTSAHTLKRHHEPDEDDPEIAGARPADKLARTDFKGRMDESSFARSPARGREEVWASENNAKYNSDSRANERRGRNKSPDSRNRSVSPIRGRTSGYDQYIPSQHSRSSPSGRDMHSPNRPGLSRHTISQEKSRDVNRPRCHNCDQPDHSTKDCPESMEQRDHAAKEMRSNAGSQTRSYSNKKFDIKKDEERDYQASEDEHQTSRSSVGYYHHQHQHQNNYRGRGRGRGGYVPANGRGGYRPSRVQEGSQDGQNGNGSAALNLEEGG